LQPFQKYQSIATIPKINEQIVDNIDTPNTQIYDRTLSWLGAGTSMKSGGLKVVLWTQFIRLNIYIYIEDYPRNIVNRRNRVSEQNFKSRVDLDIFLKK
jgi:hypothetical protein